jgi:hypothetical protein
MDKIKRATILKEYSEGVTKGKKENKEGESQKGNKKSSAKSYCSCCSRLLSDITLEGK